MKKGFSIFIFVAMSLSLFSCGGSGGRNPLFDTLPTYVTTDVDSISFGEDKDVVSFFIQNKSREQLDWWVISSCTWLPQESILPESSGSLSQYSQKEIFLELDRSALKPGENETMLRIYSGGGCEIVKVTAFKTTGVTGERIPALTTLPPSDINVYSAILKGIINDAGNPEYSERGFVVSLENNFPSIGDSNVDCYQVEKNNEPSFSCYVITEAMTTYYVRAYAVNDLGIAYGNVVSFYTSYGLPTVVMTFAVSDIMPSEATFNGTIVEEGAPPYSERGFCYATHQQPEITDNRVAVGGTGTGNFSARVQGLIPGETYYVCAYAIQNGEVIYGKDAPFFTEYERALVSTLPVYSSDIGTTSARLGGYVVSVGNPPYTERGFCYAKSPVSEPTITDYAISVGGTGTGGFEGFVEDLEEQSTYYVRAYVVQEGKISYGNSVMFMTK